MRTGGASHKNTCPLCSSFDRLDESQEPCMKPVFLTGGGGCERKLFTASTRERRNLYSPKLSIQCGVHLALGEDGTSFPCWSVVPSHSAPAVSGSVSSFTCSAALHEYSRVLTTSIQYSSRSGSRKNPTYYRRYTGVVDVATLTFTRR